MKKVPKFLLKLRALFLLFNGCPRLGPSCKEHLHISFLVSGLERECRRFNGGFLKNEAAIENMVTGDLYVSLGETVDGGAWSVRVYHKPFVTWIWAGCLLMAIGGLLALSDRRYRIAARREDSALAGSAAVGD